MTMTTTQPRNDWDSFEVLHVVVEQLEICQKLLRSRSHSKARAAVILLDHVVDSLMYRACNHDFDDQEYFELVIPPKVPQKRRDKILSRFDEKIFYAVQTKKLFSTEDATVLRVSHRVRNFAYHRNYHNPATVGIVGRILYKTVCSILPALSQQGEQSYSIDTEQQVWTKRYGVTPTYFNFDEVSRRVASRLAQNPRLTFSGAARGFKSDLFARYRGMQRTLKRWLALTTDRKLNEMLKHYEFADVHKDDLLKFLEPLKKARYVVHDIHKDIPPEEWNKISIAPERRREIRHRLILTERTFKNRRQRLFSTFRQSITANSLRRLGKDIHSLPRAASLAQLLSKYDSIERRLTQIESYVLRAESDLDFAIDIARGK